MKHLLATSVFAFGVLLSGCGGGGDDAPASPTTLQVTDTTLGTGTAAAAGNTLTVNYTGWLYSATATNSVVSTSHSAKSCTANAIFAARTPRNLDSGHAEYEIELLALLRLASPRGLHRGSLPAGRLGEQTAVDRTLPTGPTPTAT